MKECPQCGRCEDDQVANCPEDHSPLETSLAGPRLIDGKYLLLRCLGKGGMGSVYLARHVELQKDFALKLILRSALSDPQYLVRFRTEAKALGKLRHPHIIQVTDYGVDEREGGLPYLVMEYLRGRTLRQYLGEHGPLDIGQAAPLLHSIASALDYAHSCGVLHRDLNPKNVFLVDGEDAGSQARILDFGLARIVGERHPKGDEARPPLPSSGAPTSRSEEVTRTLVTSERAAEEEGAGLQDDGALTEAGVVMGTPGYIPPEIMRGGAATKASDIYSFGVIMYELIVGQKPLPGEIASDANPSLPPDLDAAFLGPLSDDPERRPPGAAEALKILQSAFARSRFKLWRRTEVPKRIGLAFGLTLVLALLFVGLKGLAPLSSLENLLFDLRLRTLPPRPPADSMILLSIDEATLQEDPTLLVNKADEMGTLLQRVLDAGAKGVAFDFLLPESWGASESFARLVLKNQDRLALAGYIKDDGGLLGLECLQGLTMAALGSEENALRLFGFLNMRPDPDGRIRRAVAGFKTRDGRAILSLPAKAYRLLTGRDPVERQPAPRTWIDYSADWTKFRKIPWKDLSGVLAESPTAFSRKVVFVGGEYEASQDSHRVPKRPGSPDELSGLLIQALILNTWLQDKPFREVSGFASLFPALLVFLLFSAAVLIRPKAALPTVILFVLLSGYVLGAFLLFSHSRRLVFFGTPLIMIILGISAVFIIRRGLSFLEKPEAEGRRI
jgi:serine/threonine protein kinase